MTEIRLQEGASSELRVTTIRRGVTLELLTVCWNLLEGGLAVCAGIFAGSIALIGFGVDSFIETASAAVVGWRLWIEARGATSETVEKFEKQSGKIAGWLLIFLAIYVAFDSCRRLLGFGAHANESALGIGVTIAALVVMSLLAKAKLKVANEIGSKALKTDAMETSCCAWLAAATLLGLVLNATLHWWWADPLAGLVIVPVLVREALEGIKGEQCNCHADNEQSCAL